MLPYSAHKRELGFTLPEISATVLIIGILAAVSAPSLSAWYSKQQVNRDLENVHGALVEAQRQAMRKGQSCSVRLTSSEVKNPASNGCLLSERVLSDGIEISTNINGSPAEVTFSYKGNPVNLSSSDPDTNMGTVIIARADNLGTKRCLVITNTLGLLRTGNYTGSTSPMKAEYCTDS